MQATLAALDAALRPVEKYAVKWLEQVTPQCRKSAKAEPWSSAAVGFDSKSDFETDKHSNSQGSETEKLLELSKFKLFPDVL